MSVDGEVNRKTALELGVCFLPGSGLVAGLLQVFVLAV